MCKAKRGGLKDTLPDDILAPVLKAVVERTGVDPKDIGDIVIGSVLAPGAQRANECRMAAFFAGFPGEPHISTMACETCEHVLESTCLVTHSF